jgi:hypothetical protein
MVAYVRGFLRRALRRDVGVARADELVGDFTADALEKGWMGRADPLQGQFRHYLGTLLHRHCCGWLDRENAKKRRPSAGLRVVDAHGAAARTLAREPAGARSAFDRAWVGVVLARAVESLRAEDPVLAGALDDFLAPRQDGPRRTRPMTSTERGRRRIAIERVRPHLAAAVRDTVRSDLFFEEEWAEILAHLPRALRDDPASAGAASTGTARSRRGTR